MNRSANGTSVTGDQPAGDTHQQRALSASRQADTAPLGTDVAPVHTDVAPLSTDVAPLSTDITPVQTPPPAQTPPPGPPVAPVPGSAPAPVPAGRRSSLPRTLVAALVVGVLIICSAIAFDIGTSALGNLNPFRHGVVQERTIDRSGPVVLKSITDLGDFQAASGYYELVVDVEKDVHPVPSFLAGSRVLFIAAGTVQVGVDLRGLGDGSVQVSSNRTSATINLPKPNLSQPTLDLQRSYVYSQQRGLVNRLKDAVGSNAGSQQQLYALASQRLTQAAQQNNELTLRGETNTRAMLQGLLRSLGFTSVTINFAS